MSSIASKGNNQSNWSLPKIIAAAAAGTVIEWYDFFIFGTLAAVIATQFFPKADPTAAFMSTLATFAAGFVVRPFGALFFGAIGDLIGRKYAFLLCLLLMGGGTAAIGIIPSYEKIGVAAPILVLVLRLLQGLAIGGEYGGAAIYVAEHAEDSKRGYWTSWIQLTATAGLFLALGIILGTRLSIGDASFTSWGWRIPFLASVVLVGVSFYIRSKMAESPLFTQLKAKGKTSKSPLKEAFGSRTSIKLMALSLLGATMGQGVVWYTGQFYALYFLQTVLKIPYVTSYIIIGTALLLAAPLFIYFGRLSDRIGRKNIMLWGMALAAITYYPIYMAMNAFKANPVMLVLLVFIQAVYVTMVYGPMAAFLVELFPAKIRYTSLSFPYHIGNGIFGGLVPTIGTYLVVRSGHMFAGLWYPISVAVVCFIIGAVGLRETHKNSIWSEVDEKAAATAD